MGRRFYHEAAPWHKVLSAAFVPRGFDPDDAHAKALLDPSAQAQAAVLSFGDTFSRG